MLIVSLSGIDETVCSSTHAPYSYAASDILWGHRFADIIDRTPEGHQYIDFAHFHKTIPVNSQQSTWMRFNLDITDEIPSPK